MDISIVIVSWRVREALQFCLESIKKFASDLKVETIVVDNNSNDGTVEMINNEFADIQLIANDSNNGFAKAVNQGLQRAQGEYILILNPDTELQPGALVKLQAILFNNPEIGIIGPKILNYDGSIQPSVRAFPSLLSQIFVLLKLVNVNSNLKPLAQYLRKDFDYTKQQAVEQLMGAALMFRRSLIDKIGVLDERFYIWFEEIDFCLRAKKAGFQVVYTPATAIIHQKGASFRQILPLRRQMIFNNSLIKYFAKNVGWWQTAILIILWPISFLLTLFYSLLPKHARQTI